MVMTVPDDENGFIVADTETEVSRVDTKAVAVLNRSEVEAQLDAAHKYRRSVQSFMREAMSLACVTREVAESCIYALPRAGEVIRGPSVRLAEICASAYGNLHVATRIVDIEEKEIVAQAVAWDLEKNVRITVETRRRITSKTGRRYNDDMITMTGNAAASIALRNAIFRVIPRAYVEQVYNRARRTAVGDAKTLGARRQEVVGSLVKMGVPQDRIFALMGKQLVDLDLDDVEKLIGFGTVISQGSSTIDEVFPAVSQAPAPPQDDGRRISMRGRKPAEQKAPETKPDVFDPKTGEVFDAPKSAEPQQREPGEGE